MTWGQGSLRAWNSPQSHHRSFNFTLKDIGRRRRWREAISWTSNFVLSWLNLWTWHVEDCYWFFLSEATISSGNWWSLAIINATLVPHSTNHEFVFWKVVLTRAQMGKEHAPFKIEFMHSARLVVIWLYCLQPS